MAVQTTNILVFDNLDQLMEKIQEMQSGRPRLKKQLTAMMREAIKEAVKDVKRAAKYNLPNDDPRKAFNAVRSSVYKMLLGGQVNILARRKNNGKVYSGVRHTRPVSKRTEDLAGYYGSDRGFVLRFLNAGTTERTVTSMNNHPTFASGHYKRKGTQKNRAYRPERTYKGGFGNRGSIEARNWFRPAGDRGMQHAAETFGELFDRAIVELWNEDK